MNYSDQMRNTRVLLFGFCGGCAADHPQLPWLKDTGVKLPKGGSYVIFRLPESTDFSWKNMAAKKGWQVSFKGQTVTIRGCTGNSKNIVSLNGEVDFRMYLVPNWMEKSAVARMKKEIEKETGKKPVILQFE